MAAEPEVAGLRAMADAPLPGERVAFERIEYGKLCTSPDGPILPGVEAYPLIRTRTFPSAVEKLCRPWIAGIGPEMLARSTHGTVVRGVRAGGRISTVACRLRRRPESGEGGGGRRYWLGRYLCSPAAPADPLTCFRALAEPLRGITPAEAKLSGRPLSLPPGAYPQPDETARRFLETALVFAMSGLPVGITALKEETFFLWAAALWHLLPGPLRPLLSAGWEVHSEQTRDLSLSTSTQFHPAVAVFDPREERWTYPERVVQEPEQVQGERRLALFSQAQHLVPGLMYTREAFRWQGGRPVLAPPDLGFLEEFEYGLGGSTLAAGEVVDLRSPWCRERLRRVGLRCLDHARLLQLGDWLSEEGAGEPEGLAFSTAKYFFPDAKERLLNTGLAAAAEPGKRDKGDRILWSSLLEDPSIGSRIPADPRHVRARLLRALAQSDLRGVFHSLEDGDAEALTDLPREIQAILEDALEASLDQGRSVLHHRKVLAREKLPEPYHCWMARRAAGLAVLLGTSGEPEATPALEKLDAISRHPLARVFFYLPSGETPGPEGLALLPGLELRDLERCRRGLLGLWERPEVERAAHRDRLIPWLRATGPFATPSPLLQILFRTPLPEPPEGWLAGLTQEIVAGGVPASLEPAVAAIVLRRWRLFSSSFSSENESWRRIVQHWPDEHLLALAGWLPARAVPAIRQPQEIELDAGQLEILIRRFPKACSQKLSQELLARTAALLWGFCRDPLPAVPAEAEAVKLCMELLQLQLPQRHPAWATQEAVATLSAMARDEDLHWTGVWEGAAQGWQMLFLLECAPWADFQPSIEQLVRLVPYRQTLQQHLQRRGIHERRQRRFRVASWEFQEASYPQKKAEHWQDEFSQTPLWAAFKHVPLDRQGDLQEALGAYARNEKGSDDLRRRVELATVYLDSHRKLLEKARSSARRAALRVGEAVIAPLLRQGELSPGQLELLLRPPRRRTRWVFGRPPSLRISTLSVASPVQVAGREVVVAPWFHELIEKMQDFDCAEELIAMVEREPAA